MNIASFPVLTTQRLLLRPIEVADAEAILFLRSDANVNRYIERPPERQIKTKAYAIAHINKLNVQTQDNQSISWGITLVPSKQLIGSICLWNFSNDRLTAEVGYDLHPDFQQQGIMNEALTSILNYGFSQLHLSTIEAYTHKQNSASIRLLLKNGFSLLENKTDAMQPLNLIFQIKNPT